MSGSPVRLTADGIVLISGKPIRLYAYSITSGGGGGGVVAFYNGTSTGGNLDFQATGTASKAVLFTNLATEGLLFPAGLYLDIDANTTSVTCWVDVVSNA